MNRLPNTTRSLARTASLVLLAASSLAGAATTCAFTGSDGPGPNAGCTTVNGIDNNEDIVGFSIDHAATPTLMINFVRNSSGSLTALNVGSVPRASVNGISDTGALVGRLQLPGGTAAFEMPQPNAPAFVLPPAEAGVITSEVAFGIDNSGVIVGQDSNQNLGTSPCFVDVGVHFTVVCPQPAALVTNLQKINNVGLAGGFYSADGVHQHGSHYDTNRATFQLLADPLVPNLFLTQLPGLNDKCIAGAYWQDTA